jgi:hypothetical protein
MFLRDDAIRDVESADAETRQKMESEIGKASLELSLNPQYAPTAEGKERITDAKVGSCSNGLTWVDEVHSTDRRVLVWMSNCLRPINELNEVELAMIKQIVSKQQPNQPHASFTPFTEEEAAALGLQF